MTERLGHFESERKEGSATVLGMEENPTRGARRMLTLDQLLELVPIGRSTLKRMMKRNEFPRPHYISPNKRVWYEDEIEGWQQNLPAETSRKRPDRKRDRRGRLGGTGAS